MTRTAFVIPWFGRDLLGGAEQHIFQVATRLASRGHAIEVLTTCCRSFHDDWQESFHREGTSRESGVLVRRFGAQRRDAAAFDMANREMLELNARKKPAGVCPVSERAARAFVEHNIHSSDLLDYLERKSGEYHAIVFAPYLYGPTLRGVALVRGRAYLQPMLHDETYAYLPQVEATFHSARRILFNSEGEQQLAVNLYGPAVLRKGVITGEGVEEGASSAPSEGGEVDGVEPGSYLLYLGRRDPTKNTDFLLRAFQRYRDLQPPSPLQLVLAGPGDLPPHAARAGIVDAGIVTGNRKAWLLAHCRALVQPSRNESYSRTVMEAWLQGHPVVVHSECLATRIPVEATGGGWAPATEAQWADVFARIELATAAELGSIGERGRAYAREHADWTKAIDRYEEALELRPAPRRSSRPPRRRRRAIHQLLPNLAYGDAISNQATFMREVLNDLGYESEIFVQYVDNPMRYLGRPFEPGAIRPRDGLLYHHSIGTELTAFAVRHKGPKALIYHNVTPASFFEPWDPPHARLVAAGRKGLSELAPAFPISAGVSQYNASELRAAGFRDPRVLPIFVEPLRWDQAADPEWMKALQDGRTNLLFVGRVAPNKCQHDLVEAFAQFLSYDAHARLLLIGAWLDGDRYATYVRERAQQLGIASQVVSARCSDAQLLACYRTADLFWSMSEHEGFCVPLVEAMWFDIPVLGFRSSAIPETLGQAGLMFAEKRPAEVAALAHLLIEEGPLRRTIVEAQRRRRRDFLPDATLSSLLELLRALGADDVAETRVVS